jgi:hypothetical protein
MVPRSGHRPNPIYFGLAEEVGVDLEVRYTEVCPL